ncbi:MAG: tail fiber domain-containing protein, partial [Patescibacteria group bacterium]
WRGDSGSESETVTINPDGNVGIGTTGPLRRAHIHDGSASDTVLAITNSTNNNSALLLVAADNSTVISSRANSGDTTARRLDFMIGGITRARFESTNGNFGVGQLNPQQRLDVGGRIRMGTVSSVSTSDTICYNASGDLGSCSSSIRYKENIVDFGSVLEEILQLRPIVYDWKSTGETDIGFIAEEVHAVNPNYTFNNQDGVIEGVRYSNMVALLTKAIQEQQAMIASNSSKLSANKTQLSSHAHLHSDGALVLNSQGEYQVTSTSGSLLESIISAAKTTSARLTAGITNTRELIVQQSATITNLDVTNTLRINGQKIGEYVAGIVQSEMEGYEASGSGQVAESQGSESATPEDSDATTVAPTIAITPEEFNQLLLESEGYLTQQTNQTAIEAQVATVIEQQSILATLTNQVAELQTSLTLLVTEFNLLKTVASWTNNTFEVFGSFIANGPSIFRNSVAFEAPVLFGSDSSGILTIPSGTLKLRVNFNAAFPEAPLVYLSFLNNQSLNYFIEDKDERGFTLVLQQAPEQDTSVQWLALLSGEGAGPSVNILEQAYSTIPKEDSESDTSYQTDSTEPEPSPTPAPSSSPDPEQTPEPPPGITNLSAELQNDPNSTGSADPATENTDEDSEIAAEGGEDEEGGSSALGQMMN